MKSIRLTSQLRDEIKKSVRKGLLDNEAKHFSLPTWEAVLEEVKRRYVLAGESLWLHLYGGSEIPKKIKPLLSTSRLLTVSHEENPDLIEQFNLTEAGLPCPGSKAVSLPADEWDAYLGGVISLRGAVRMSQDSAQEVVREVAQVLQAVNTTKQLVDAVPAIEPWLPAHIADPSKGINLPIPVFSRLQQKLAEVKNESDK